MKKVLITGANGLVGRSLKPYLLQAGFDVHAMDIEDCNLCIYQDTSHYINKCNPDFLVHLASMTNPNRNLNEFSENFEKTVIPSIQVALSLPTSTRLALFFGSIEEYGNNLPPFKESLPPIAISGYGWAKTSSYHAVSLICRQRNIPMTWIRPSLLFGPHMSKDRFVGHIIHSCLNNKPADLTACEQTRDLLFIDDFCNMFLKVIQNPSFAESKILNICSGQPRKLIDVAILIQKIIGKGQINFGALPYREHENMNFFSDASLFNSLFGPIELTPFEVALKKTIYNFHSHPIA